MRFAKPLLVALLCIAGGVYATNYSLWINGRSSDATGSRLANRTDAGRQLGRIRRMA